MAAPRNLYNYLKYNNYQARARRLARPLRCIEREKEPSKKQEFAMTALRKIRIEEEPVVAATEAARAPVAKLYVVTNNVPAEAEAPEEAGHTLKNIVLFFAAPFIGLAYIVAFPFIGLAVLAVLAGRAAAGYRAVKAAATVLKTVGMAVAAPVLGLAYIVLFPFIGLAALAWMGGRAAVAKN
jgi:hypothetical protein